MRYPVAAPDLSGNEARYVQECLESTWISAAGKFVDQFESTVAGFSGARHAVATSNGTVALHLALRALDLGPGDEVVVPSLTYVATANAVSYCGATPVFADCEPDTWCLSPQSVQRVLSPRTRGIIPVHLYGHPCEMDALQEIAERRCLWIVEDAAEAIGAKYRGEPVGALGDAGMFSFFGNKIITTGEGGMAVTRNACLAERMKLLRGQAMDPNRRYWHVDVGYNYRLTNLAAAIGVAQMERVHELLAVRRQISQWYRRCLSGLPECTLPVERPDVHHVFWMYSILLERADLRADVMAALAQRGIETRPFFFPLHEMPMYREAPSDGGCPVAVDVSYRGISLPTSPLLCEQDVRTISKAFREALAESRSCRLRAA